MNKIILVILLFISLNSYSVTYPNNPYDNGMINFQNTMNNYFNNPWWITTWDSFDYTSWYFASYDEQPIIDNLFAQPYYQNSFNNLNLAKQNGILIPDMLNLFYNDISYGVVNKTPSNNVDLTLHWYDIIGLLFVCFIIYWLFELKRRENDNYQ